MVIALALVSFHSALAESPAPSADVVFRMEFSRTDIYEGEQVIANFMLYSKEEVLDVEVAKFPEFRGFWSENLSLRQGPIPLMGGSDLSGMKRALVGSYILTTMIGNDSPSIVPLKLVVRHPLPDHAAVFPERALLSEAMPLHILPLPPPPKSGSPGVFKGAVGHFTLAPESTVISFQKDEPVTVRYVLQGEGNFPEVNAIDLPFPPQVEILSRRAATQGAGQYASKTFEITLVVHSDQKFDLPSTPFLFFNPEHRSYEQIVLPSFQFLFQPPPPADLRAESPMLELPPPEAQWTAFRPLLKRPGFLALQALLALMCFSILVSHTLQQRSARKRGTKEFQHQPRF